MPDLFPSQVIIYLLEVQKVCKLAKDGNVMASPTEAVLFRTNGTLGIDEFEGVANKDKSSIRELLNGAYKKGIKITPT